MSWNQRNLIDKVLKSDTEVIAITDYQIMRVVQGRPARLEVMGSEQADSAKDAVEKFVSRGMRSDVTVGSTNELGYSYDELVAVPRSHIHRYQKE